MIKNKRVSAAVGGRRIPLKNVVSGLSAARLLRNSFYYLKAEQFLKTSGWLACEAG